MKLTPLDIKKQEFKRTIRGYDPVEVDAFLEMIADELETIMQERSSYSEDVLRLHQQLEDYQQVEKTLKETLVNAQESISTSRQNSQREADLLLREAELKAEKIVEDARARLEKMKNDLTIIKAQKDSFARRLRHLLESQMELIGVLEMDDLGYDDVDEEEMAAPATPPPAGARQQGLRKVDIPGRKLDGTPEDNQKEEVENSKDGKQEKRKDQLPRIPKITDQFIT